VRAVILLAVLVVTFVVADRVGAPDRATVQALVDRAGGWAPLWFVGGYAVWSLLPVPKSLATVAAGAAFGLASGSLLAWLGAASARWSRSPWPADWAAGSWRGDFAAGLPRSTTFSATVVS